MKPHPSHRWLLALGIVAASIGLLVSPLTATRGQREVARALDNVAAAFERGTLTTRLEVLRADGLPKQVANFKADLALAAPDRLWLATTIEKERIELARDGQRIWVWQPGKSFGVIGEAGVPRFMTAPETSRDDTKLGPLALPISRRPLALVPRLYSIAQRESETIDGTPCRVLHAQPHSFAQRWLPRGTFTLWLRESDGWPVRVGFVDGKSKDALIALHDLQVGASLPESRWQMPAPDGAKVERVALSHLRKFFDAALLLADTKIKPLGPATGERRFVASHGTGRLEMHDDTPVLFLRGTPEQMGEQHGTLLAPQVRGLVQRVLYGVGVGSSFAKGKWFFGEIEQCQARIGRFIEPRHLREMDAIARATGLAPEEVRLANFFPELFHCSGFALMGKATSGRRIFHGRVLDYMKGVGLEASAVVTVNQPDEGHAWVNIGYAGFTGTVTAMNDQHISIGEMGGRGEGNWDGKPMAQLLREVMEKASTLDEAIEIMRRGPRTCEYFYVIADGKTHTAVGLSTTPERFEVVRPGEAHPLLSTPVEDAVLLSSGDRYTELVRRVQAGYGKFDADTARELMTRPVCMASNIHSVLFAPDALDFWVANADSKNVASHCRYTHYNLGELLGKPVAREP